VDKSAYGEAARCLAELGHPNRLQAFRLLIQAGEKGLPVGEIQRRLAIPKSTLAHHLAQLVATGLVTQTREGRVQRCRVEPQRARALLRFLVADCCDGLPGIAELEEVPG